jgi:hypothetical protein
LIVAVPAILLEQLLRLDERERVEIAHALLESIDERDELPDVERERLHAAIETSIAQLDAGQGVSFDDVIASLRAKRLARAR